jgi:hypothetical protein
VGLQAAGLHSPETLVLLMNLLRFAPPEESLDGLVARMDRLELAVRSVLIRVEGFSQDGYFLQQGRLGILRRTSATARTACACLARVM